MKKKNTRSCNFAKRYAHRGYHDKPVIPENSLPAFRRAVEHGLGSEFDVHLIADGSMVIFHDSELERQTGVKGLIEDYDIVNLRKLRLEGTDEVIPTFDEVLDIYENSGLPVVIELKVARNNYQALVHAVCDRLDSYKGEFVLESFDPRAVLEMRKYRPDFIRGQLAQDFIKCREGLSLPQAALLTNLAFNIFTKPDFVAYKFQDRENKTLKKLIRKQGIPEVLWTIKTPKDYRKALKEGCIPIFERFDPDEAEKGMKK